MSAGQQQPTTFQPELDRAQTYGSQIVLDRYRSRCATIGAEVVVHLSDTELRGEAVDIDDNGRLVVAHDGTRTTVDVGDVIHVRPQSGSSST